MVGWVCMDPTMVWSQPDTEHFKFGEVYVQTHNEHSRPIMVPINVYKNYNFCGRAYGETTDDAPVMRREVLRSLNPYNTSFTIMFDETVSIGATERSRLWKYKGVVQHITMERRELIHSIRHVNEEDETISWEEVKYEGLSNRLLVSYYPVPSYDPGDNLVEGFFSCEWFHAAAVQSACFWIHDRYHGYGPNGVELAEEPDLTQRQEMVNAPDILWMDEDGTMG